MKTNKTPIRELINLLWEDLEISIPEEAIEEFEQKEKQFAFDCFEAGGEYQEAKFGYDYVERGITHDADDFEQFYSQYAEQHNK